MATVVMVTDRCALRPLTLYYGWLLPMSLIILHNLVVFALVLRVLCRKQPGGIQIFDNFWINCRLKEQNLTVSYEIWLWYAVGDGHGGLALFMRFYAVVLQSRLSNLSWLSCELPQGFLQIQVFEFIHTEPFEYLHLSSLVNKLKFLFLFLTDWLYAFIACCRLFSCRKYRTKLCEFAETNVALFFAKAYLTGILRLTGCEQKRWTADAIIGHVCAAHARCLFCLEFRGSSAHSESSTQPEAKTSKCCRESSTLVIARYVTNMH